MRQFLVSLSSTRKRNAKIPRGKSVLLGQPETEIGKRAYCASPQRGLGHLPYTVQRGKEQEEPAGQFFKGWWMGRKQSFVKMSDRWQAVPLKLSGRGSQYLLRKKVCVEREEYGNYFDGLDNSNQLQISKCSEARFPVSHTLLQSCPGGVTSENERIVYASS